VTLEPWWSEVNSNCQSRFWNILTAALGEGFRNSSTTEPGAPSSSPSTAIDCYRTMSSVGLRIGTASSNSYHPVLQFSHLSENRWEKRARTRAPAPRNGGRAWAQPCCCYMREITSSWNFASPCARASRLIPGGVTITRETPKSASRLRSSTLADLAMQENSIALGLRPAVCASDRTIAKSSLSFSGFTTVGKNRLHSVRALRR
jgi:hypothetical protein